MNGQDQAQNSLSAFSQQLTHYLQEWIHKSSQQPPRNQPPPLPQPRPPRQNKSSMSRQKIQISQIGFPLLSHNTKSAQTLHLPLIGRYSEMKQRRSSLHLGVETIGRDVLPQRRVGQRVGARGAEREGERGRKGEETWLVAKKLSKKSLNKRSKKLEETVAAGQIRLEELKLMVQREMKHYRKSAAKR